MTVKEIEPGIWDFELDIVGQNAAEILELCYQDIPRDWICGKLTTMATLNGHRKPQGCAMGLAMMNGGMGSFMCRLLKPPVSAEPHYDVWWNEPSDDAWRDNEHVSEAVLYLALTIPENHILAYKGYSRLTTRDGQELSLEDYNRRAAVLNDWRCDLYESPSTCGDIVVNYNDSGIDKPMAAAWFAEALELAKHPMPPPERSSRADGLMDEDDDDGA
jgi:hypothetical protein